MGPPHAGGRRLTPWRCPACLPNQPSLGLPELLACARSLKVWWKGTIWLHLLVEFNFALLTFQEHYTARSDLEEGPSSYPCTNGVKKSFAAKNLPNSPEHPCHSKEVWGRPRLLSLLRLVRSSQVLHHCLALVSDISHQMPWRSFRVQLLAGRPCWVRPIDQDCRKPQNVSMSLLQ